MSQVVTFGTLDLTIDFVDFWKFVAAPILVKRRFVDFIVDRLLDSFFSNQRGSLSSIFISSKSMLWPGDSMWMRLRFPNW